MQNKQIYIADTIHGTILLSAFEKEIISTQLFNRLHNISQNSTAYLTFPTNRTKRFEHSLGTMKLCGDILFYSLGNSTQGVINDFFEDFKINISKEIISDKILCVSGSSDKFRPILKDDNLTKVKLEKFENYEFNSVFYNSFTPKNIELNFQFLYLVLFQAIRICGLLHDIGHPPFSHIAESAINNVYNKIKEKSNKTKREEEFFRILNEYDLHNQGNQLHEKMGNQMTNKMISDLIYSNHDWYKDKPFEQKYFKVLVFEVVKGIFSETNDYFKMLHGIIDGVIDGDRLDYVNRDIKNSGINNGEVEYDRLITSMKLVKIQDKYVFASDVKTANTVEDFFFKRWNLYKNIIYHHRVIKTDSLLENCIENIIYDYLNQDNSSEQNMEGTNYVLPYDISGLWKAIEIAHSNTIYFNSLIQWDDGWLFTILKKHYFCDYYDKVDNVIKYQLEELLSNKKNYFSIIKNNSDFQIFTQKFEIASAELSSILSEEFSHIQKILIAQNPKISIFNQLDAYFEAYYDKEKFDFRNFIREKTSEFISEKHSPNIKHHVIIYKSIKSGLSTEPYVYKEDEKMPLSQVSNIKTILESEKLNFPYFYIYVKFDDRYYRENNFEKMFLEELGGFLSSSIIKHLQIEKGEM